MSLNWALLDEEGAGRRERQFQLKCDWNSPTRECERSFFFVIRELCFLVCDSIWDDDPSNITTIRSTRSSSLIRLLKADESTWRKSEVWNRRIISEICGLWFQVKKLIRVNQSFLECENRALTKRKTYSRCPMIITIVIRKSRWRRVKQMWKTVWLSSRIAFPLCSRGTLMAPCNVKRGEFSSRKCCVSSDKFFLRWGSTGGSW